MGLKLKKIRKSFPGVLALDDVDFEVNKGEVVALVGENGAGKSTLARIVCGIYRQDSGSIFLDGEEISIDSPSDALKYGIAYVPQSPYRMDSFTVGEYLGLLDRRKREEILEKAKGNFRGLQGVELGIPLSELDEMQLSLLWFQAVVEKGAEYIFLDETFSTMPEEEKKRAFEIIRKLAEEGKGVVYVTHKLSDLKEVADRVVVLRKGKVAGIYSPEQVEEIRKAMFGEGIKSMPGRGNVYCIWGIAGNGQLKMFGEMVRKYRKGEISVGSSDFRYSVFFDMTVFENLLAGFLEEFGSFRKDRLYFQEILRSYGIKGRLEQKAKYLSGGNLQRVVVARALERARKTNVKLIVLYNPAKNLDEKSRALIWERIIKLSEGGKSVIVFTEDEEDLKYCRRIGVIKRGRIVYEEDVEKFDMRLAYKLLTE